MPPKYLGHLITIVYQGSEIIILMLPFKYFKILIFKTKNQQITRLFTWIPINKKNTPFTVALNL